MGGLLARGLALAIVFALSACAGFSGEPRQIVSNDRQADALAPYFSLARLQAYWAAPSDRSRNEIVYGRMAAMDILFDEYARSLMAESGLTNTALDVGNLSLTTWASLTHGVVAQNLSGIASVIGGLNTSVNKNAYYAQTLPSLVSAMVGQRLKVRRTINAGLALPLAKYPLEAALVDLQEYHYAGTIAGALSAINENASKDASASREIRLLDLTAAGLSEAAADLQTKLIGLIKDLSKAAALALWNKHPPVADPGIVEAANKVFEKQHVKDALRTLVSEVTSADDASLWEAAIQDAKNTTASNN